ncbi:MAG: hypothetical protein LBM77_12900 [Spirochaetaceae bacterium]|jgi:hypothetical protein|nr:hypothetical protein [Spirochaetaceae bacterium]
MIWPCEFLKPLPEDLPDDAYNILETYMEDFYKALEDIRSGYRLRLVPEGE